MAAKAKVKRKVLPTINEAASPFTATVDQVPQTRIASAISPKPAPVPKANSIADQAEVMDMEKENRMQAESAHTAAPGDNIYDERIGGYGRKEPGETGEDAVRRIMRAKVKRKK